MTEISSLIESGNWSAAAAAAEQSLQQSPHDPKLNYQLGLCQFKLGNFKSAAERFSQVLQAEPAALGGAHNRARIHNDWAVSLFHCNDPEAAAERLREALSIDPDLLEAKLNLGLVEAALSEHEHSSEVLADCLNVDPANAEAHLYRGIAYLFEGKGQEAAQEFEAASNSGLPASRFNLWPGYAQLATGNTAGAVAFFEQHLTEHADDHRALDALGCALILSGDINAAIAKFEAALKVNPQFALARWHLAGTQAGAGQSAAAKNNYSLALSMDAGCLDAEKKALERFIENGELDTAAKLITQLLEVAPQDAELQLASARILIASGHNNEAEQALQKLVAARPLNSSVRALLGDMYLAQLRLAEADEQYRNAAELGGDDSSIFLGWGKALTQLGLNELAVEKFQRAAQIDPFNADIYDHWGATLKSLGRFAEAAQVYKQAADYIF